MDWDQVVALRAEIDDVDTRLSALIDERAAIVARIAAAKARVGVPARDASRERAVVEGYVSRTKAIDARSAERFAEAVLLATRK